MCVCIYIYIYVCVCVCVCVCVYRSPSGASGKEPACQCRRRERWPQTLGREDPLEEGMAPHSSTLAWRIPWTEEPGGYSPWGHTELATTEVISTHTCPLSYLFFIAIHGKYAGINLKPLVF